MFWKKSYKDKWISPSEFYRHISDILPSYSWTALITALPFLTEWNFVQIIDLLTCCKLLWAYWGRVGCKTPKQTKSSSSFRFIPAAGCACPKAAERNETSVLQLLYRGRVEKYDPSVVSKQRWNEPIQGSTHEWSWLSRILCSNSWMTMAAVKKNGVPPTYLLWSFQSGYFKLTKCNVNVFFLQMDPFISLHCFGGWRSSWRSACCSSDTLP